MKRRKARERPDDARTTLAAAQGEAHEARTLLALAALALEDDSDGPRDADLPRVHIAPSEVARVLWQTLARLDAAIQHLDEGLTAAAPNL